ncbi:MAG TPA: FMN-binding glutamate synthase family protein [Parafilimonas sp.]|nr:FMN-binding glutamate synthase family protein [Parafilimonas sp.]
MLQQNHRRVSIHGIILVMLILLNGIILTYGYIANQQLYWWLAVSIPLLVAAIYTIQQKKQADHLRPGLSPYFFEQAPDSNQLGGRQHSIVYQSATNTRHTFGIHINGSKLLYKWAANAAHPQCIDEEDLRITIGNHQCSQPYNASILNIGVSGYGALSNAAVQALYQGAMLDGFAYNTGEDGISPHHLNGGNLIWQIGPGYFGCRNENGKFDTGKFVENAIRPEVKMIELKLLQRATSGYRSIVPAKADNTPVAAGSIISLPQHTAFSNAESMLLFLESLRELSFGKPVGFRLCIENKKQFHELCYCIQKTGIIPDFITVDGAEEETGSVLFDYEDKVGMPLYEALTFVSGTLQTYGLRQHIKIIAAGEIISGFDILKTLALGADACCSAGASRFTQMLQSDSMRLPAGTANGETNQYKILHVTGKKARVTSFHKNTLKAATELMAACGFKKLNDITVPGFFRLMNIADIKSGPEVYALNKLSKTKNSPILN